MKTPLAVGDRVRLRGYSLGGRQVEGLKGVVDGVRPDGDIKVKLLDNGRGDVVFVYPSQCVRLVKKERREWYIYNDRAYEIHNERSLLEDVPDPEKWDKCVHVSEVRPRKERK